jgi:hypothetical protein
MLVRLIEGLNDGPDSIFKIRILGVVSVKKSNPHRFASFFGQPVVDETLNLSLIHELHVVHMPELLGFNGHVFRFTSRA